MNNCWASARIEVGSFVLVATAAPRWKVKYLRPDREFHHLSLGPVQVSVWRWPSRMFHWRPDPHRVHVAHPHGPQPN